MTVVPNSATGPSIPFALTFASFTCNVSRGDCGGAMTGNRERVANAMESWGLRPSGKHRALRRSDP
jgi:hypothetical protein